ncbi:MAG: cytochrome c biogenesis protein CcdA [Alphaproteobacteria bacterium]
MIGNLLFAYIAGAVATANPCGFALLPAFIARRLSAADADSGPVLRALAVGGITTLGFVLLFGVVGGAVAAGLRGLGALLPAVGFAIGAALVVLGVASLAGRRVALPLPGFVSRGPTDGLAGDFVFGLGYGAASLGCTLPIFLAVAGTALTESVGLGAVNFIAYGLGMGTVLSALAVTTALARSGLAQTIASVLPYMSRISGTILVLAGLYVSFYWLAALGVGPPNLIFIGDQVAAKARVLTTSPTLLAIVVVALGVAGVWSAARKRRPGASGKTASPKSSETEKALR